MVSKPSYGSLESFVAPTAQAGAGATRDGYGAALLDLARVDPRIICLGADLTAPTETDLFRDQIPERYLQVGIAEANMIGVAGGLARAGYIPFVHSFCVFLTRRSYDQVAMQVAYPQTNVKLVGFMPGITTALGVSHQAIDDIALMRALPNMTIIEPSGPHQIRAAVEAAARHAGPVYLRLKRRDETEKANVPTGPFALGRMNMLRDGSDALIVACGMTTNEALEAATQLERDGISSGVIEMPTIKPLDRTLVDAARKVATVVTVENHSIVGGLGSAVVELLMDHGVNARVRRLGLPDTFALGASTRFLMEKFGLDAHRVAQVVREASKRRAS